MILQKLLFNNAKTWQILQKLLLNQLVEYSVYYLRCLFCLTVHLMSIYSEGVHVFGVAYHVSYFQLNNITSQSYLQNLITINGEIISINSDFMLDNKH